MIKPKHNQIFNSLFYRYIEFLIKNNFKEIKIIHNNYINANVLKNYGTLIISNHISWWDGFIIYYLNNNLLKKKFYILMLEEQLKKHFYFKYLGAFSIKKKSRDIINSIDFISKLLEDHNNIIVFFPQGKIHSQYLTYIKFESGLRRILENIIKPITIIFIAIFFEYLNQKKPTIFCYLSNEILVTSENNKKLIHQKFQEIQNEYNLFYLNCLENQKKIQI